MRKKIITAVIGISLQFPAASFANSVINLSTSHAEGRSGAIPSLTIWAGTGLSLDFTGTGERVVKAWLDDPSRLTLDFDTPNCSDRGQENCGASVIHLRRIHPVSFPRVPSTPTTLLTVVTEGAGTRKVYYFNLGYGSGRARYVAVNINTDPRPALRESQRLEESTRARAARIERGLRMARDRDRSGQNTEVFDRVETLLARVRGGMSFSDALRHFNLAPSVLEKLENLARSSANSP
ncbi:hypothetical protein V0288_12190 [Pannus brasiliensis CCIBt3594]|uniref:Uncharacterized protein n=1 Tax=Pannus brasiliensis CCIBt3594 TaxID=1427578 RepID=A0AAW9QLA5_9CHRO